MLYHQRPSAAVCQVPAAGWELSETVLPRAAISASLTVHEPDVFQLLLALLLDFTEADLELIGARCRNLVPEIIGGIIDVLDFAYGSSIFNQLGLIIFGA